MPHAPVMRATPARQQGVPGGKLYYSHGPKTQRGQNVRRCRVGPPPESHTAEEIEQAESLVVPLHEVLLRHADAPAS